MIIVNSKFKLISLILFISFISSCDRDSEGSKKASLLIKNTVQADAETDALKNRSYREDAADDPAIWIHPTSPEKSRIIGTDKKGGLAIYNLDGKELFFYADGKMNNVDIRQNITIGNKMVDILGCSNRTTNTLDFYKINKDGSLHKYAKTVNVLMNEEVYGFCLAQYQNKLFAIVNSVNGNIEQWEISFDNNTLSGSLARKLKLESKTECMVADDENGLLFIGEEAKGIWKVLIDPSRPSGIKLLTESTVEANKNIYEDIEGLCLYKTDKGEGYLIASSQGNYSYALFERNDPHKYIGSFRIIDGAIDGVEETDGLDVTPVNLGSNYPHGMLIVQDGYNKKDGKSTSQNFKMVRWEKIANLFKPKLTTLNSSLTKNNAANYSTK